VVAEEYDALELTNMPTPLAEKSIFSTMEREAGL
jgi:hypothetical protein